MDLQGFSVEMNEAVKEAITLARHRNGRTYEYELAALFARIWFLKAEIMGRTVTEEFLEGLRDGSRFLLTSFPPKSKELMNLVEQVPVQVETQNGKNGMVRDLLHKFLVQAMLFKAEALLSELRLNHEALGDRIGALEEGIVFLIKWDINQPKKEGTEDEKRVLADLERLAAGVISLCRSIPEPAVKNMESQLSGLLDEAGALKSELKNLYFRRPRSDFPKTPGLDSVRSLLERLKGMRVQEHDSLSCAAYEIEAICRDLELCLKQSDVDDTARAQLVEAAYQVEHVIDSMGGTKYSEPLLLMWLYDQSLVIKDLLTFRPCERQSNSPTRSGDRTWDVETPVSRRSMLWSDATDRRVGFEEEKAVIINRLTRGTKRREVVSITGMAGAGKSTLAREVFMSRAIVQHFPARAWCTVSEVYTKYELLHEILYEMTGRDGSFYQNTGIDDMQRMREVLAKTSPRDLEYLLYKSLEGKRYLIVMDDVWSSDVLRDLEITFPDDSLGSRILMTSRNVTVVPNSYPLCGLTEEESCELLRLKIFGHKGRSFKYLDVAKQIARLCKGLPLAVVSVAGVLRGTKEHFWPGIAEEILSEIATDPMIMKIVDLSYSDLPDNLKECFLYFGVYPKDEDILVRKLLWLWIAEGFVHKVDSRSLEDLAEDYLMVLIDRSLVSVTKLGSNGKIKKCRVHSILLGLCLIKAKQANFSQSISGEHSHRIFNENSDASDFNIAAKHRLTVFGNPDKFIASKPPGTYVRSLLHFATDEKYPGCHSDMLFISQNFEILKVMSLESINVGYTLENDIGLPVHLRYLAVGGDMTSPPSSLPKLQDLHTLIVKGLMNKFVLPSTIWSMKSLRHIDVSNHCIFTLQNDRNGSNSSMLDSLVSLSMPSFSYVKETDYILKRFPNLRKLKCVLLEPCVGSTQIGHFPTLESLQCLESLKLTYHGWPLNTVEWNLPSTLKELSLSNFRLPWEHISTIGELPNLEVLKLISEAFEGTTWEMEAGKFEKLKYLGLVSLNLVHWYADDELLPNLEHLVLRNCEHLAELPEGIKHIPDLQRIEVHQCTVSVEESVRSIVETQLEYGNVNLISNIS